MGEASEQNIEQQPSNDWKEKVEQVAGEERRLMKDAFKFAISSKEPTTATADFANIRLLRGYIGQGILNETMPRIEACKIDGKMNLSKFKEELKKPGVDPMLNLVLDQSFHFLQKTDEMPEISSEDRNELIGDNMRESLLEMDTSSRPHEPKLT